MELGGLIPQHLPVLHMQKQNIGSGGGIVGIGITLPLLPLLLLLPLLPLPPLLPLVPVLLLLQPYEVPLLPVLHQLPPACYRPCSPLCGPPGVVRDAGHMLHATSQGSNNT